MKRIVLALVVVGAVASACSSGNTAVTGEITKLDRSALPPEAVVTIELRDISLADAPAKTLSTQVIELNGDQLPVPYELAYDEDQIDERSRYTVFARIEAAGSLIYITDTAYPVITGGNPTDDVEVLVVPTS